jgi:hypothetical protein
VEQTAYEGLYETPACLITADETVQPDVLSFLLSRSKIGLIFKRITLKPTEPELYIERTGRKERKRVKELKKKMKERKNIGRKEKGTNKSRKRKERGD